MGTPAAIEKLVNGGCRTGFPCSELRTTSRQAHGKIRPYCWRLNYHHQVTCSRTWGPGNTGTSGAKLRQRSALQSHSAKQRAGGETDRHQPVRQKGLERPIHSPRPREDDEDAPVKKSGPPMVVRINSMLKQSRSCRDVLKIVARHLDMFDYINCATAMSRLGHLSGRLSLSARQGICEELEFEMLLGTIENLMWEFGPQAMGNTMWGLGRLEHYPEGLFLQVLAGRALWCLGSFKPQEISNIVWGLAELAEVAPSCRVPGKFDWGSEANGYLMELLNAVCEQASTCVHMFKNKELCTLLWALGRLELYHPYFMEAASSHIQTQINSFNDQDVSNTAWACAHLRYHDYDLLESLAEHICSLGADGLPAQAAVNVLTSFASLGYTHERAVEVLARDVAFRASNNELSRQQLCNALWALATLQVLDQPTAALLASEVEVLLEADPGGRFDIDFEQLCHAAMMLHLRAKGIGLQQLLGVRPETWRAALEARKAVISHEASGLGLVQEEVRQMLEKMKLPVGPNQSTADGLMCIPLAVQQGDIKVAVEVEIIYYHIVNGSRMPTGERKARWALLEARGWHVVVIPAWKLNRCKTAWRKTEYLAQKLSQTGLEPEMEAAGDIRKTIDEEYRSMFS